MTSFVFAVIVYSEESSEYESAGSFESSSTEDELEEREALEELERDAEPLSLVSGSFCWKIHPLM